MSGGTVRPFHADAVVSTWGVVICDSSSGLSDSSPNWYVDRWLPTLVAAFELYQEDEVGVRRIEDGGNKYARIVLFQTHLTAGSRPPPEPDRPPVPGQPGYVNSTGIISEPTIAVNKAGALGGSVKSLTGTNALPQDPFSQMFAARSRAAARFVSALPTGSGDKDAAKRAAETTTMPPAQRTKVEDVSAGTATKARVSADSMLRAGLAPPVPPDVHPMETTTPTQPQEGEHLSTSDPPVRSDPPTSHSAVPDCDGKSGVAPVAVKDEPVEVSPDSALTHVSLGPEDGGTERPVPLVAWTMDLLGMDP